MPAPAIALGSPRYTFRGLGVVYWVVTISNYLSPTTAELNAGVNITPQLTDGSGWGIEADQIETPDASTLFTKSIPGVRKADECTLTGYKSYLGVDFASLMGLGAIGNIVTMPGGMTTGRKMNVWPVQVASAKDQISFDGSSPDTVVIKYSPSQEPALNILVP